MGDRGRWGGAQPTPSSPIPFCPSLLAGRGWGGASIHFAIPAPGRVFDGDLNQSRPKLSDDHSFQA